MTPGGADGQPTTLTKAGGAIEEGRLLVVGGGVLSRQNGQPRLKRALGDYLAPFTEDFSEVRWIGGESREPLTYQHLPRGVVAMEAWSSMSGELVALAWQRAQGKRLAAVLHLPNIAASIVAPCLWLMRVPVVAYFANDWWRETIGQFRRGRALRGLAACAEVLAAIGGSSVRYGRNTLCNRRARQFGVDIHAAASLREAPLPLADKALPGDGLALLYIGKLEDSKGLDLLLRGFRRALDLWPAGAGVRLWLAGQAKSVTAVQQKLNELGLSAHVDLLGFVDDQTTVLKLIDRAAAVCITSIAPEGFPRVIEEASVRGKPLVVADNPSLSDLLAGHGGVLRFSPESSEELGERLTGLLGDTALRDELAFRSLEWARANPLLRVTASAQHRAALTALVDRMPIVI